MDLSQFRYRVSTDENNLPVQIINWFVLRWNIEVTFAETRMHLGVETQRQWSDNAIQRCTPLLMAMYSILTLVAIKMNDAKTMLVHETTSWYDKNGELTFADIILKKAVESTTRLYCTDF